MSWSVNHDINLLVLNSVVQPLFMFLWSCWELGCPDVICETKKSRGQNRLRKLEIESDEIEFELNVHMLLLFSASLLVLLLPRLLGFFSPPLSASCGTVCSSSIEMIYWCQVVNLLSLFCSSPVVFRGSSHFLLFPPHLPENTSGSFVTLCEETLRVWQMPRPFSMMFPPFSF